jgi:hypothetical protein
VTKPAKKPTLGSGKVTTPTAAKELPFTGDRTSTLALWGLASLLGGVGFTALGQRQGKHAR